MPDTLTLPARHLAEAWLNTDLAYSEDDSRPALYRTTVLEVFPQGIQLIATDSLILIGCFVPYSRDDLVNPPAERTKPERSYIVMDHDKRMSALMKFMRTEAKAAEKAGRACDVRLSFRRFGDPDEPALDTTLEAVKFVAETEIERLALPLYESTPFDWRAVMKQAKAEKIPQIGVNPEHLARFGKLHGVNMSLRMRFAGPDGLCKIDSPGSELYLFGGIMPARIGADG